MSVDTSISIGVGFVVPEEAFKAYRETIDDEVNYGDDELLEMLPLRESGLCCGTGGSYYTDREPLTHWIAISRLTQSHDTDDIPGGVIGLSRPTITLAEREQLNRVASILKVTDPVIGQFMSVLWY